jgi:hypothetical protein
VKVLVTGGRDYADKDRVTAELDRLAEKHFHENGGVPDEHGNWMPLPSFVVIHGGCNCEPDDPKTGADFWANEWCICNWVDAHVYPANWKTNGRAAGPIRNREMLTQEEPDLVLAFPGGRGTSNMVRLANEAGVPVQTVTP